MTTPTPEVVALRQSQNLWIEIANNRLIETQKLQARIISLESELKRIANLDPYESLR